MMIVLCNSRRMHYKHTRRNQPVHEKVQKWSPLLPRLVHITWRQVMHDALSDIFQRPPPSNKVGRTMDIYIGLQFNLDKALTHERREYTSSGLLHQDSSNLGSHLTQVSKISALTQNKVFSSNFSDDLTLQACYRAVNNICPKIQTLLTYYSIISVPGAGLWLLAAVHLLTRLLPASSLMGAPKSNFLAESCDGWEQVHMQA